MSQLLGKVPGKQRATLRNELGLPLARVAAVGGHVWQMSVCEVYELCNYTLY